MICTRCTETTTCGPNLTYCVFVSKVLWKHRHAIYLCIACGYFSTAMTVLGSFSETVEHIKPKIFNTWPPTERGC